MKGELTIFSMLRGFQGFSYAYDDTSIEFEGFDQHNDIFVTVEGKNYTQAIARVDPGDLDEIITHLQALRDQLESQ